MTRGHEERKVPKAPVETRFCCCASVFHNYAASGFFQGVKGAKGTPGLDGTKVTAYLPL